MAAGPKHQSRDRARQARVERHMTKAGTLWWFNSQIVFKHPRLRTYGLKPGRGTEGDGLVRAPRIGLRSTISCTTRSFGRSSDSPSISTFGAGMESTGSSWPEGLEQQSISLGGKTSPAGSRQ